MFAVQEAAPPYHSAKKGLGSNQVPSTYNFQQNCCTVTLQTG